MKDILNPKAPDEKLQADWSRQLASARAICERQETGVRTVLLADEVGMGKTYVAMATIAMHLFAGKENDRKALLVVPSALLASKWEQELRSFNKHYLGGSSGNRQLRPVVIRNYWELIQNLHDYKDFEVTRISEGMLGCFAFMLWHWNERRRERGRHRVYWAVCGDLTKVSAAYLNFCSRCSPLALFNFLDDQLSRAPDPFKRMLVALDNGQNTPYLKELFRRFAVTQDAMESNVFVIGMGTLRRTRSDHGESRMLITYLAAKALWHRREDTWKRTLKTLVKANLAVVPEALPPGGKRHLAWLASLAGIDLWGMRGVVERLIADIGQDTILNWIFGPDPSGYLVKLREQVVSMKLSESGVVLAVVDEVHNWKNGGNGAGEFKRYYRPFIPNKLLMSATPFQLDQEELGRVFGFATGTDDQSEEIVNSLLGDQGPAQQALEASGRFQACWLALRDGDMRLLNGALARIGNVSSTVLLPYIQSLATLPEAGESLAAFIRELGHYHTAIRSLRAQLAKIAIRHTKPREKRHVHAGADYTRQGVPDYAKSHQVLYEVAGLGDEAGALLNYVAMRVEQRVRRDTSGGRREANAHLLNGFASSRAAFEESNAALLKSPNVLPGTRRYLDFFAGILRTSTHPKVGATVERAISNYRAGAKTLIFCDRLKTQQEIVSELRGQITRAFFAEDGIDGVKRERRNLLAEYRTVELYWSRSWLSQLNNPNDLEEAVAAERPALERGLEEVRDRLGDLNGRQRNKVLDLLILDLISHRFPRERAFDLFRAILNCDDALRIYLRLVANAAMAAFDDDPDDDAAPEMNPGAIVEVLAVPSIWHPRPDAGALHLKLWQLVKSEFEAFSDVAASADPTTAAHLLLDIGQGIRKILLRLDTLKGIERGVDESVRDATLRMLGEADEGTGASPWLRTLEFLTLLIEAQGSIRRPQNQSSRRQSLWKGVYLRDEEIVSELHGGVSADTRVGRCAAFNSPLLPDILVCTAIGSEGIDLHLNCDEVIHHDLPWNPAKLEQRTGRIDRVGSLAERLYERDPARHRLDIGIPFLAYDYDDFQYRKLLARAQTFEILLGKPEFTLDVEEEIDDGGQLREHEEEPAGVIRMQPVSLPQALLDLVKMDLAI